MEGNNPVFSSENGHCTSCGLIRISSLVTSDNLQLTHNFTSLCVRHLNWMGQKFFQIQNLKYKFFKNNKFQKHVKGMELVFLVFEESSCLLEKFYCLSYSSKLLIWSTRVFRGEKKKLQVFLYGCRVFLKRKKCHPKQS